MHRKTTARVLFRAGKNYDGYFTNDNLVKQLHSAMDLLEDHFPLGQVTGLFLFDNATTHQKRSPNALSARYMPLSCKIWNGKKGTTQMHNGILPNGDPQEFYWPNNHEKYPQYFKGMRQLLEERDLWRTGLRAQCEGFKCAAGSADCCARQILFCQPDFKNQKSELEEIAMDCGHIVVFYPKFHCELNFIEMCWGRAKFTYRMQPRTKVAADMAAVVCEALDDVSLLLMRRFSFLFLIISIDY